MSHRIPDPLGASCRRRAGCAGARLPLLLLLCGSACATAPPPALVVRHTPLEVDAAGATGSQAGVVALLTTLVLEGDSDAFGGLSGLELDRDGETLHAISDHGSWFSVRLELAADGRLSGLAGWTMAPLLDRAGAPVVKSRSDAESLTRLEDGSWLVGFEWEHRIWRYDDLAQPARPFPTPPGLENAPSNGGLESLAALPGGGLLALTEHHRRPDRTLHGWVQRGGEWHELSYVTRGIFVPTDLAVLRPSGDVLVLERSFVPGLGNRARIRRIRARAIVPGATLDPPEVVRLAPPLPVDNFEGLAAARHAASGAILLYLVSDDNFSARQRTLLYQLRLREPAIDAGAQPRP